VVEGPALVRQAEWLDPEQTRQLEAGRLGLDIGAANGRPGAVELLRATREREGLERVEAEASRVRRQGLETAGPARVCDPGANGDLPCDLDDRAVGDAEKDQLRIATLELPARDARRDALREPSGHGFPDASGADDTSGFESH
jgi:hypothetical protein